MTQPATPLRIPESMGPDDIGPYMRSIREHFKLSPQDVSERLHIRVRYVNAIEEGKFELMPGKVYARGYIHTYAEFLGLDADQVVEQCFKPVEAQTPIAALPQASTAPKMAMPTVAQSRSVLRGLWLPAFAVVAGLVLFTQLTGEEPEVALPVEKEKTVTQVPEALLPSQGETVMPTAQNFECLTGEEYYLTCFFAQRPVRAMDTIDYDTTAPFVPGIVNPPAEPMDLGNTVEVSDDN